MEKLKIYFGGPHVFLPPFSKALHDDHIEKLAEQYGFEPLIPKDGDVEPNPENPSSLPLSIYTKNIRDLEIADAIVADITPFRGVSLDAGTAFEIGYARARGIDVLMWSDKYYTTYEDRVYDYFGTIGESDNMAIEDFSLTENLMITPHIEIKVYKNLEEATIKALQWACHQAPKS